MNAFSINITILLGKTEGIISKNPCHLSNEENKDLIQLR